jgi:hypothetical protein
LVSLAENNYCLFIRESLLEILNASIFKDFSKGNLLSYLINIDSRFFVETEGRILEKISFGDKVEVF